MEKSTNRILTIDLVRGLSVLLMIPVHAMMIYSTVDTWTNSSLGKFAQLLEKGTPIFLVAMGLSFVFSHRSSMVDILKRGIRILLTGYLLNLLRFVIPMLFFGGLPKEMITGNGLVEGEPYNLVYFTLLGDILQLSGMSLILMGIILKFIKEKYAALIAALLIIIFSKELSGTRLGIIGLDYFLDLLWGNKYNVYFPVFPWMSFIFIGLFFGMWYKEKNKNTYYMFKTMLPFGIGFILMGGGLCWYNYEYHFGDYYHLGPGGTIILIGINLMIVWVSNVLTNLGVTSKLLTYCSENVTSFYFIQWVLIYWGISLFGFGEQESQLKLISIILGITILTFIVLWIKLKVQKTINTKIANYHHLKTSK